MNLPDQPRTRLLTIVPIPNAPSYTLNVLDGKTSDTITSLMRRVLDDNLDPLEQEELEDTLEALIPALTELRDHHGETLTLGTVMEHINVAGFSRLALDERLADLLRMNCAAMARRHAVYLKRAIERLRRAADGNDR